MRDTLIRVVAGSDPGPWLRLLHRAWPNPPLPESWYVLPTTSELARASDDAPGGLILLPCTMWAGPRPFCDGHGRLSPLEKHVKPLGNANKRNSGWGAEECEAQYPARAASEAFRLPCSDSRSRNVAHSQALTHQIGQFAPRTISKRPAISRSGAKKWLKYAGSMSDRHSRRRPRV